MSKTSKTTSSSSTPAHQQKQGQDNRLILAMAACLALSSLLKLRELSPDPTLKILFSLTRIRFALLGYFVAKGVAFDAKGNPCLPAVVLDAHPWGFWSNMPASIFLEAHNALLLAVQAGGVEEDEQNPATQAVAWLFTQALKAGADRNAVIDDPDLGGPRPVVVLSFYCDPTTGSPIWGPLQSLLDES